MPEPPLCFDERKFLFDLLGGGTSHDTLEDEARSWLESAEEARGEKGEEIYGDIGEAIYHEGFAEGIAAVLCDLAWTTKGIHVSQKGVIPPTKTRFDIDLTIVQERHEVWFDLPRQPDPLNPLLLPAPDEEMARQQTPCPPEAVELVSLCTDIDVPAPVCARSSKGIPVPHAEVAAAVDRTIALRREERLAINEIGERLGVPHTTLGAWLRAAGIDLQAICPTAKQVERRAQGRDREAIIAEAQRLRHEEGLGRRKIAERLGLPEGSMGYYLEPGALDRLPRGGARKAKPKKDRA